MNNIKNKNAVIVSGLLFVVWFTAMISFGTASWLPLNFYTALAFGSFSLTVSLIYLLVFATAKSKTNEIRYIPVVLIMAYLVISLAVNFLFCFYITGIQTIFFLNVLLLCTAVGGIFFSEKYVRGVERKVGILEDKQSIQKFLSQRVGKAILLSKDEEVKKKLLSLKELVDYSNALSIRASEEIERALCFQFDTLENMLLQGADRAKILERIEEIIVDVKYRNTIKAV